MDTFVDPVDLLARLNPVPDELRLPATRAYVPAQRTLQRILDRAEGWSTEDREGPRRRRFALLGAAVGVTALVAVAAAWVVTRPADDPSSVACYASPDLNGDVSVLLGRARDPIEACREVWRTGEFQGWGGVPPLAGCVLATGEVGVFPGEPDVCDRLGLARLASDVDDERLGELVNSLSAALAAPRCVDVAAASDLVRARLDELDLEGWTLIAPATTSPARPCASIAFDPPTKTVTLVPIPPART